MTFHNEITDLQTETLRALTLFGPELALCATIVLLLLLRIVFGRGLSSALIALVGSGAGLALAIAAIGGDCCRDGAIARVEIFGRLLIYDAFTAYFRTFLLAFSFLFVLITWKTGIPDNEDGPDFYTLALGAILGMCLMASANHLLIVFLAIEMASVPSYALAGMLKGRKQSSEAALKFSVYGAGAAGIMLYGISLIAGAVGKVHLPDIAVAMSDQVMNNSFTEVQMVLALGGLMVMVGVAFKLSAVPFHFWAPDVFEGASAEIGGFLSVASKAAAIALLVRLSIGLGYIHEETPPAAQAEKGSGVFFVASEDQPTDETEALPTREERMEALGGVRKYIAGLIAVLAAVTATFGNLAAYGQTNIKRLLAYSTIAHAGYMMMPVAAAVMLLGTSKSATAAAGEAAGSVAFYLAMYLFMNLGAFMIVAFLRNRIRSEEINDYAGLIQQCPGLVICFCIILFSLVGLPPLAGFVAKWTIFAAVINAELILLAMIGVLNSVLSLFYYLRVIKVMILSPEPSGRGEIRLGMFSSVSGIYVLALSVPVLVFGIFWDHLYHWAVTAAKGMF